MKAFLLSVFIFFFVTVSAQDTVVHFKGFQASYHPFDFFFGIHYSIKKKRMEHQALIQFGVTRTFFQTRIYPQIGYQFGYHFVDLRRFRTGVFLRPIVSFLHVNRAVKHGFSYFEEACIGGFIGFGERSQIRFSAGFGPGLEQKWSESKAKFASWFSWNYFGQLSWSYAL